MSSKPAAVLQFEAKCTGMARDRANTEKWFVSFASQPQAVDICKLVLEHSTDMLPQFHAAKVIGEVIVQQWDGLEAVYIQGVRTFLLGYTFQRWSILNRSVRNKLLQAVAVFWKRGWLTESAADKAAFLSNIQVLLTSTGSAAVNQKLMGIHLASELLGQFCHDRSTTISMPLEFHRACREAFKTDGLRQLWSLGNQVIQAEAAALAGVDLGASARTGTPSSGGLPRERVELLSMALGVMAEALEWQFEGSVDDRDAKCPLVTVGAEWSTLLLNARVTDALFALYGNVRFLVSTQLPHKVREAILQMCCLSGAVFPDDNARRTFFSRLLKGVLSVFDHPLSAAFSSVTMEALATSAGPLAQEIGDETLMVGQGIYRLIENFKPRVFGGLPHEEFKGAINKISAVTCKMLSDASTAAQTRIKAEKGLLGAASGSIAELLETQATWTLEAFDFILESWVSMLTAPEVVMAPSTTPAVALLRQCCSGLFSTLVTRRLEIAVAVVQAGIDDDNPYEDPASLEQHLECAAVIARASPSSSLALLTSLVRDATQRLTAAASSASAIADFETAVACLNERLFWLVWMTGYVLADAPDGEAALVPDELNTLSASLAAAATKRAGVHKFALPDAVKAADPVLQATNAVFDLMRLQFKLLQANAHNPHLSPLVFSQLLWFMDRWQQTYLMPNLRNYGDTALSPVLTQAFSGTKKSASSSGAGAGGGAMSCGADVVEFVAQNATLALSLLSTEPGCTKAALGCLRNLVKNKSCASVLLTSPTWRAVMSAEALMVNAAARNSPACQALGPLAELTQLNVEDQRALVAILVGATKGARVVDEDSITFGSLAGGGGQAQIQAQAAKQMQGYFMAVAGPVKSKLDSMLSQPCFATTPYPKAAKVPAVEEEVIRIMNLCQGAVCPAFEVNPAWLLPLAVPMLAKCSHLIRGYGTGTRVTATSLAFAVAFAKAQVFKAITDILTAYTEEHSRTKNATKDELSADLHCLLELVSCLIIKDGLDFGSESGPAVASSAVVHVVDVAMYGVRLMVRLMTPSMLAYPSLARLYLRVVGDLCDQYPEKVCVMETGLLEAVLMLLSHGMSHPAPKNQRVCLEGLYVFQLHECVRVKTPAQLFAGACYSLASYHVEAVFKSGMRPGVGLCTAIAKKADLLNRFISPVLSLLLAASTPAELVDPAANVLLALVIAERGAFDRMVTQYVALQSTPRNQERLRHAFTALLQASDKIRATGRPFLRKLRSDFMRSVREFVKTVRAFVVIK